ncbi:hypothetical protein UCRPC4_g05156 [Phaeomoniella chlamydospora]|uniref:Altered inheritance of mitochondria protein 41 n=1 Tax=Phaeomoniella chlamydospora TaxID=158046 RepID=A0A0G2E605_PHACM|nr:hypothetical protein UCRPC4_g05156 [Phaeomoniella chlamydospora]
MYAYRCPRCLQHLRVRGVRFQSTTASDAALSPLMAKIRSDLKTAMRAKDTTRFVFMALFCLAISQTVNRLNVLRSVITEVSNASKTSSPIKTDLQVLALLRKKAAMSRDASKQFAEAKRDDLKEKEDAQTNVVEEYIGEVAVMSEEDIEKIVKDTIEGMKSPASDLKPGQVLQKLFEPNGVLDGKPVEKKIVAQAVARLLR